MSQFYQYTLNKGDLSTTALAKTQSLANAGNLILNGVNTNSVTGTANLLDQGISPTVTLTSANDLSAVVFTISGTQNGVIINETKNGPPTNTIQTANTFDVVNSITASNACNGISVGIGSPFYFPIISINTEQNKANLNYALQFSNQDGTTCIVYISLNQIAGNKITYNEMIAKDLMIPLSDPADGTVVGSAILSMNTACKSLLILDVDSNVNSEIIVNFLQV